MPGKVKVRIVAGRNLPVMDRASDTTDAYVEVKLGSVTHKTDVFRKSLNPSWNSEWFRFEVDDHDLQDEPLQIRLMDHDTYSANDAIGKVYVDLNPLLLPPPPPLPSSALTSRHLLQSAQQQQQHCSSTASTPGCAVATDATPYIPPPQPALATLQHHNSGPAVMSGWLPVYDTMHGLRGEVGVVLKVDLFSDFNRFRQSSCGVHFFFSPEIPATFTCECVVGLVEELVINHDPEYEWIDKIRSPRASNEAKQTLFCKLSGMLQRKIGLKVLDMGGNAVLGYRQCFDLEGESGIVVRGLGTAVVLSYITASTTTTAQPAQAAAAAAAAAAVAAAAGLTAQHLQQLQQQHSLTQQQIQQLMASISTPAVAAAAAQQQQQVALLHHYQHHHQPQQQQQQQQLQQQHGATGSVTRHHSSSPPQASQLQPQQHYQSPQPSADCGAAATGDASTAAGSATTDAAATATTTGESRRRRTGVITTTTTTATTEGSLTNKNLVSGVTNSDDVRTSNQSTDPSSITKDDQVNDDQTCNSQFKRFKEVNGSYSNDLCETNGDILYMKDLASGKQTADTGDNYSIRNDDGSTKSDSTAKIEALTSKGVSASSKVISNSDIQVSKQAALETTAEGNRVNVLENFEYPEGSRKIQRTATVIEQETLPLEAISTPEGGGYTSPLNSSQFKSTIVTVKPNQTSSSPQTSLVSEGMDLPNLTSPTSSHQPTQGLGMTTTPNSAPNTKVPDTQPDDSDIRTAVAPSTNTPTSSPTTATSTADAALESLLPTSAEGTYSLPFTTTTTAPTAASSQGPQHRRFSACDGVSGQQKGTQSSGRYSVSGVNCFNSGGSSGPPPPFLGSYSAVLAAGLFVRHPLMSQDSLNMLKYPFFTMTNFPSGFVLKIGGTVSARCVKLLERAHAAPEEVESRDSWWAQLRGEVRMHARALGCNAVLGYNEFTTICDEVCILNVSGTAAIVCVSNSSNSTADNPHYAAAMAAAGAPAQQSSTGGGAGGLDSSASISSAAGDKTGYHHPTSYMHHYYHHTASQAPVHHYPGPMHQSSSFEKKESDASASAAQVVSTSRQRVSSPRSIRRSRGGSLRGLKNSMVEDGGTGADSAAAAAAVAAAYRPPTAPVFPIAPEPACCVCHSPFADAAELPFKVAITTCAVCKRGKVSDIVLATIEPPPGIPITGRGVLIQARVFKQRRDLKGEQFAKEVSDALPFVEYEITRQIINKVRVAGMNAVFGLRVRLSLGEKLVVGIATGTAVYLTALPPPYPPQVSSDGYENEHRRRESQRLLNETMHNNMKYYGVLPESSSVQLPQQQQQQQQRPVSSSHTASGKSSDTEDDEIYLAEDSSSAAAVAVDQGPVHAAAGGHTSAGGGSNSLEIDFGVGNKEACLLELDDSEDAEMVKLLLSCCSPSMQRLPLVTTRTVPGMAAVSHDGSSSEGSGGKTMFGVQMFTKLFRETFPPSQGLTLKTFNAYFDNVIQSICYRVRKLHPCVITGLRFDVEIPDEDQLQITVLGAVVRFSETLPHDVADAASNVPAASAAEINVVKSTGCFPEQSLQPLPEQQQQRDKGKRGDEGELMFKMEDDGGGQAEDSSAVQKAKPWSGGEGLAKKSSAGSSAAAAAVLTTPAGPSTTAAASKSRKLNYASSSSSSSGSISRPQLQHQARLQGTPSLTSFPSAPSTASLSSGGSFARMSLTAGKQTREGPAAAVGQSVVQSSSVGTQWQGVFISPLPFVPGARVERHLGNLNFFFIRESNSIKEGGGVSVFVGGLVTEIISIVRAHVAALGGTALTSYFMAECMLELNPHKNQGQCLINVGGDVVQTTPLQPAAAVAAATASVNDE